MTENVLSMTDICKSFGGVPVLKGVNFSLNRGSIHALVGGNGAGKSTLMKIMTGVYACDSGEISVNGETKKIQNPNVAREYGIKMIFQELSLIPTLTVAENIYLNHEIKRGVFVDKKAMEEAADRLLTEMGVSVDVKKRVSELDVGICQLIEIAKALSTNFSVLVMDEPTASLTEEETGKLFEIMRRLKEKGASIVYISHRLKEVLEIADEISVLRDGRVVRNDAADAFTMESLIDDIIGKRDGNQFRYVDRSDEICDEIMLDVQDLTWDGNPNRISFSVRKGEVVGLVGLLGSGRTEVVETLFGIRKQKGARITIDGKTVHNRGIADAIGNGFALIPEDRRRQGLILMHSIRENAILPSLAMLCRGCLLNIKNCNAWSEECITEFNVKANGIHDSMMSLSGGNQQKIVIAKWFKKRPKVLLMDEPTAGVDIGAKTEIIKIIRKFVKEKRSVIFISSELSEVLAICDRIIILKDGKIKGTVARTEIKTEEELQHAVQV